MFHSVHIEAAGVTTEQELVQGIAGTANEPLHGASVELVSSVSAESGTPLLLKM